MGKQGTNKGKKFSDEWRKKISEGNKGKILSEKQKDMLRKLRLGTSAPNRKITFEQAQQIREEYKTGETTKKKLSEKYKISEDSINKIINNKSYLK